MLPPRLVSLVGFVSLALIAFLFSEKRSSISFKQCFNALFLQIFLAFFMLKTSFGLIIFSQLSCAFEQLYTYAYIGAEFVLGKLTDSSGPWGVVFAIKIAPVIIFFGALISLFFHWGIISKILSFSSKFIQPFLYTSKAETLSLVAGLALGQTETPMLVKKYLPSMTRAQLLTLMISCMSHLSCAIIAVYSSLGISTLHLLASSVMALPGSVFIAKILLPDTPEEREQISTNNNQEKHLSEYTSFFEAIIVGTLDGLSLAINILAILIVFIGLTALVNHVVTLTTSYSLNTIIGFLFYPLAILLGIDPSECTIAAQIIGKKLVLNEFIAYGELIKQELAPRTMVILTYALAGFSNLSCIGIQVGSIGTLCPSRRTMAAQLGIKALFGGTLVNLMNAALVGMIL